MLYYVIKIWDIIFKKLIDGIKLNITKIKNLKKKSSQEFNFKKKISILKSIITDPKLRHSAKYNLMLAYKRRLLEESGVRIINPMSLASFDDLDLQLSRAAYVRGNTTYLEMMCILGLTKKYVTNGKNFLEIGTFDGNLTRNISINLDSNSKIITIDLPEDSDPKNLLDSDDSLIEMDRRKKKKHLGLSNVEQVYGDSTKIDFSRFDFNGAFIDGGHDFETVRLDTINILKNINKPGFIAWHDYAMETDVEEVISSLYYDYDICYVEGTNMVVLELN